MTGRLTVGIDVGGTFTDLVAVDQQSGMARAAKVLTTPDDQGEGVAAALRSSAVGHSPVDRIVHGTTVVTNMLLERRGARVVLCATRGATDLLQLRRQERAALYDLSRDHPAPLVSADDVIAVEERIEPQGVAIPLTERAAQAAAEEVAHRRPDIVAISLLHAYSNGVHERALAQAIVARNPGVDVVCSSDVLPEIREYERTATTVCEAYARPGVARYLSRLGDRVAALGMPLPGVVTSSGGMHTAVEAASAAAALALSGPAGGVAGAALVVRAAGFTDALSIDIGGTSADVGLILGGQPLVEAGGMVAGVPIALPRVLVETVSAGGGSLGWIDDGGALRVGPRSAGARPGPVAFGQGGTQATVTDAHVASGHIRTARFGAGISLHAEAARHAVGTLAAQLGVSALRCAQAMIETADAEMARALRRVSVARGIDPRRCVLVAFGGGGPLHACGLAERLGMTRILVPPFAGVLSALGLAVAPEQRVGLASVLDVLSPSLADVLERRAAETQARAGGTGVPAWVVRARFRGQGHELEVPWEPARGVDGLGADFTAMHHVRYGFVLDTPVEVVSLRCTVSSAAPSITLQRRGSPTWRTDESHDDGSVLDITVAGPHVIDLPDATLLVHDGWSARALPLGGWLLERAS